MEHLLSLADLSLDDLDEIVRLAVLLHDSPSPFDGVLEGATVGLVLPQPRAASAEVKLQAAVHRLGATPLVVEPLDHCQPTPMEDVVDLLKTSALRTCVVAGPSISSIEPLAARLKLPAFHVGQRPDDPWIVLAGNAAARLLDLAHQERAAVDEHEAMLEEAMVPTAAAVIALLSGCVVPTRTDPSIDLRTPLASHWFG